MCLGIGGSSGWGVMGESLEKTVTTIAELIESNLMKLADQRAKMESESARNSPKGGAAASPMTSAKSTKGAFAFSDEDMVIKPSMMLTMDEDDAGDDSADARQYGDAMEEID